MNTPYFVIDQNALSQGMDAFKTALQTHWSNYVIGYSFKTNALPWILQLAKQKGLWAEVVSADEYALARRMGFQEVIYNGPVKTKESFLDALRNGAIVNVDSQREIEWLEALSAGETARVGVRVNFDLEVLCPGESSAGDEGLRFGFCLENGELEKALDRLSALHNVTVCGIHLHCSTKTRSLNCYRAIARTACRVGRELLPSLDYVDIGGGYFGGLPGKPSCDDYIREVAEILSEVYSPEKTALIVEPGMALVGAPVDYVTEVVDVKETGRNRFAVLDGSRIHVDPQMKKTSYLYAIESRDPLENRPVLPKQVLCGFTCMENDRFFALDDGPELRVGDRVVFRKVGAYTMCLSPLFIQYFPDVYVESAEGLRLVRKKWDAEAYLQNCEIGEVE